MIAISILLYFFADEITRLLFSDRFAQTPQTIRILSIVPAITGASAILMNVFLIGCGYVRIWSKIVIGTGWTGVALSFILTGYYNLQHIGAALAFVIVETSIIIPATILFFKEIRDEKRKETPILDSDTTETGH